MQSISNEIRNAVIMRYFDKCKAKYNKDFFEWRNKKRKL